MAERGSGLIALACTLMVLVACGGAPHGTEPETPEPAPTPAPAPAPPPSAATRQLTCPPVVITNPSSAQSTYPQPPPSYSWQSNWQSCEVSFKSLRSGSQLYAVLFAPANVDFNSARLPAVVITPASSGAVQTRYHWAARYLAGNGYLVLTVDPQGVGRSELVSAPQSLDNYIDATDSALSFLLSTASPVQANVDPSRLGAAGHSLSARAVSWLQGEDRRIGAIVAWDNLSSTRQGDAGTASGGGPLGALFGSEAPDQNAPVVPLVPAMGQASDDPSSLNPLPNREKKKTAYAYWRDRGIPSMQVVFRDAEHDDWGQAAAAPDAEASKRLHRYAFLTLAWFDMWLRQDPGAQLRLLSGNVVGDRWAEVYSGKYRSALYLPRAGIDCPDLVNEPCSTGYTP